MFCQNTADYMYLVIGLLCLIYIVISKEKKGKKEEYFGVHEEIIKWLLVEINYFKRAAFFAFAYVF